MQDADECIRLEPTFSKGYSRKGHLQFFMKDYDAALETYEAGLKHDPDNAELKEGVNRALEALAKVTSCPVTSTLLAWRWQNSQFQVLA